MASSSKSVTLPTPTAAPIPSEETIARKFDNCVRAFLVTKPDDEDGPNNPFLTPANFVIQLADLIVNAGLGFGVGVVASVLLFRRRGWPVALSTGFGAGVAYSNCNYSLNPYVLPGTKVLPSKP